MTEPISYNKADAAAAVGISADTLMRAVRRGDLPVHYLGGRLVILTSDLRAWVEAAPSDRAAS